MLDNRLSLVPERLPVPVHLVLDVGEVSALEGLGQDTGGHALGGLGGEESFADFLHVVTVDDDGVPAKADESLPVGLRVVSQGGGVALAESVDVDDRDMVAPRGWKVMLLLQNFLNAILTKCIFCHMDCGSVIA